MQDLIFVALDLETTGLDTKHDTIIEIAVVKFTLTLHEDTFEVHLLDERSMLVHPGIDISQEVEMITGITNEMLVGRTQWSDIREKVRDFIGDAAIVGHNVLFDIEMLAHHGIDLHDHRILDTFELSELFSQDLESLNLGFLANSYGLTDPADKEHRALTDTRISVRLFLHYLGEIRRLRGGKKRIWNTLREKDASKTIDILTSICHIDANEKVGYGFFDAWKRESNGKENTPSIETQMAEPQAISLSGDPIEEIQLIQELLKEYKKLHLLVPGKSVALWMGKELEKYGIPSIVSLEASRYISIQALEESLLEDTLYKRKKVIFLLKLAFWIDDTQTGLLDELKLYGEERDMIHLFQGQRDEYTCWRVEREHEEYQALIRISNIHDQDIRYTEHKKVIKDLPLLEDILRRKTSIQVSLNHIYKLLESLRDIQQDESLVHVFDMISIIEQIYLDIPDRPTGPSLSPPGNYGETYHITQSALWHRGFNWLVYTSESLLKYWNTYRKVLPHTLSRERKYAVRQVDEGIRALYKIHSIADSNTSIILNILDNETKILLVPREIIHLSKKMLSESIAYGVSIHTPQTKAFIERECGITLTPDVYGIRREKELQCREYHSTSITGGTIILTTSLKHARDIGKSIRQYKPEYHTLIQGLSGGKGKMLATFLGNRENTILIGLIDTWRDTYSLWGGAKNIIIAKMPFDPPTDSYFLARTVGVKNNFSEYSQPMVIIRVNTLIARILSSGYDGYISTSDMRLIETEWGKAIIQELL